jgi:hypothetical protein
VKGEFCCSGSGFGGGFAPAAVVCYCRFGGCCLTVCSGGFWFLSVLRFQVVVASGYGGFLLLRFQWWICSGSGSGCSSGGGLVCALHAMGVWFLVSVHCAKTVGAKDGMVVIVRGDEC